MPWGKGNGGADFGPSLLSDRGSPLLLYTYFMFVLSAPLMFCFIFLVHTTLAWTCTYWIARRFRAGLMTHFFL